MDPDERKRRDDDSGGIMRNVWHGVAALYAGALAYALVWQQLEVPWVLWVVVALIAEPGAFMRLAMHYGGDFLKRFVGRGPGE